MLSLLPTSNSRIWVLVVWTPNLAPSFVVHLHLVYSLLDSWRNSVFSMSKVGTMMISLYLVGLTVIVRYIIAWPTGYRKDAAGAANWKDAQRP
jgi:hypothetical protein